jgi:hypothetical protein
LRDPRILPRIAHGGIAQRSMPPANPGCYGREIRPI